MTDDLEKEAPLNAVLVHDRPGRRFWRLSRVRRWGELILPAPGEAAPHGDAGLKLLAVTAYTYSLPLSQRSSTSARQSGSASFDRPRDRRPDQCRRPYRPAQARLEILLPGRARRDGDPDRRGTLAESVPVFTGELKSPAFAA